ncbi:N-formylglutamate amidohydrolase [Chryseosolibacter indicus]|uniref:N-formylglutamate amidohydrolase n=1 Tax=Chryseosolibacter indicus TaxID=2782351 RepID=A0ABS5VQM5_9BACT|nr:N-formylglutamate amidohydrolase [Chryseosolibacter indicus]MBT1703102.1 N-formylglutamate amidohydrolase [Chryseosolibacter indicus]
MEPYVIHPATSGEIPVILSVPHCGTAFPDELKDEYKDELIQAPDDTDWFVDKLYDFAPALGITMIKAVYSRWVIDLNRNPDSAPLYNDGRIITGLCPSTNFLGQSIYRDNRSSVDRDEIEKRLEKYYWPYHNKLQELLTQAKDKFGKVLVWDCHSIRQYVKTIQNDKFPDLILGSADQTSAPDHIVKLSLEQLSKGNYQLQHNHPFKGGFITRHFGRPSENTFALQLEMTKVNYMNDDETLYDHTRAERMRSVLADTLLAVAKKLVS